MNAAEKTAYEWAKGQNYQSVAAQYARTLVGVIDRLTTKLAKYEALTDIAIALDEGDSDAQLD